MLNWYTILKLSKKDYVYGYWISPRGEIVNVARWGDHGPIAEQIMIERPEIINNFLKQKKQNPIVEPVDTSVFYNVLARTLGGSYEIMFNSGWVRVINPRVPGGNLSVESNLKYTEEQQRILLDIIEEFEPKTVFFEGEYLNSNKPLNLKEAILMITGKKAEYSSPMQEFRTKDY